MSDDLESGDAIPQFFQKAENESEDIYVQRVFMSLRSQFNCIIAFCSGSKEDEDDLKGCFLVLNVCNPSSFEVAQKIQAITSPKVKCIHMDPGYQQADFNGRICTIL